jgi:hypothetical protein
MSKEGAKIVSGIVDDAASKVSNRGFQSHDAMAAAVKPKGAVHEDDGEEPPLAEVSSMEERTLQPVREEVDASARMVKVRSREYIAPFFYGKKQYSLPAGKDVLIPLAVKRHLEEKNQL